MMKMLTAYTPEIDFVDDAVTEVLKQLNLEENLLSHSVGILTGYTEFVETGVVKALCERLPFPVVGCTTLGSASGGTEGHQLLAISVLTGDDVEFSAALSDAITLENVGQPMREAYERALGKLSASPALALAFMPFMNTVDGAQMFSRVSGACGNTPLYGTISCSNSPKLAGSLTIWNGEALEGVMAIVLISGRVKTRFFITALDNDRPGMQKGTVTDAEESLIRTVDNMPALDFFETRGISRESVKKAPSTIPVVIDYEDGSAPLASAIYSTAPEGYVRIAANVPAGAKIAIGTQDYNGILLTAELILERILAETNPIGILMLPCMSRSLMLGPNSEDELRLAVKRLGEALPYHIAYSGGEICPVYVEDGTIRNRFHNFTFTACVFEA
jgi:hypothetical protein